MRPLRMHCHAGLADVYERQTRHGPMLFVVSEARYTNQHGELLALNREVNIHQP